MPFKGDPQFGPVHEGLGGLAYHCAHTVPFFWGYTVPSYASDFIQRFHINTMEKKLCLAPSDVVLWSNAWGGDNIFIMQLCMEPQEHCAKQPPRCMPYGMIPWRGYDAAVA